MDYLKCAQASAAFCLKCQRAKKVNKKNAYIVDMALFLSEFILDIERSYFRKYIDQAEYLKGQRCLDGCLAACLTCNGKKALVYWILKKEWLDSFINCLNVLQDELARKKKKSKRPKNGSNIIKFPDNQ